MGETPSGPGGWQANNGPWQPPTNGPPPLPPPLVSTALPMFEPTPGPGKPWWRRWWVLVVVVLLVVGVVGVLAGRNDDAGDSATRESVVDAPEDPGRSASTTAKRPKSSSVPAGPVGTGEGPAATEAPPTTASKSATTLASPALPGEVVQVGEWSLRVATVVPDAATDILAVNQFNDPPPVGKQFFIATVEATYTGPTSSTFWMDITLKAVGASNVAYEGGLGSTCGVIPDSIRDAGEAFTGGTIRGNVCWSIDTADAASLVMIAEPTFTFKKDARRFLSMDPSATPVDQSTSAGAPAPRRFDGVPLGQEAQVDGWKIKVVSVNPDAAQVVAAENQFNDPPPAGKQYVITTLEATYTGDESSTFWFDVSLRVVGASAVAYEASAARCGVIPDDVTWIGEVFPGGTITGNICWVVDAGDVSTLTMLASESLLFGDESFVAFSLT